MRRFVSRLIVIAALSLAIGAAVTVTVGLRNARADPVVRRATIALPDWPEGAPPVQVALLSDIHFGGLVMDRGRLDRIVAQVTALRPDLIVIAGDFINGHDPATARASRRALGASLARLGAPLGVVAVAGNHDHWTDMGAVRGALSAGGVTLLSNAATARGPLAIGGVDDEHTHHANLTATTAAMRRLPGARVLLSHTPDIVAGLPADVTLALVGHTHCGQVVLPVIGPPVMPTRSGKRYICGMVRDGARRTVVTAGLGTSGLPVRLGAPPDLWLLTLGPSAR